MHVSHKKVAYFHSTMIGKFKYAKDHHMKPVRVAMTHSLIFITGLYETPSFIIGIPIFFTMDTHPKHKTHRVIRQTISPLLY